MFIAILICLSAIVALLYMVAKGGTSQTDNERVRDFLSARDCELLRMEVRWNQGYPCAFHKTGRHGGYVYDVTYTDANENTHFAECETNGKIGVLLRKDGIKGNDLGTRSDAAAESDD